MPTPGENAVSPLWDSLHVSLVASGLLEILRARATRCAACGEGLCATYHRTRCCGLALCKCCVAEYKRQLAEGGLVCVCGFDHS